MSIFAHIDFNFSCGCMYTYISKKVGKTWDSLEMQEKDSTTCIIFNIVKVQLQKFFLIFYKYEKYSFDC